MPEAAPSLKEAATRFVEKLRLVHADARYQSVWTVAQLHIGPYTGLKYDEELEALKKALVLEAVFTPL